MSSSLEYDSQPLPGTESHQRLGVDPAAGAIQTNLLELAWRARWMMLLTTLLGIGVAWVLLQRVEPRYTSVSRIYVERNLPSILTSDMQLGPSGSYLYTQAELIRSTGVLAAAADAPENSKLETFREVDNRVGFLQRNIEVRVGQNDDIINVSIELPRRDDAAQLVNSVVDAYISKHAEQRRIDAVEVLTILRTSKKEHDAELEQRQQALEEFRRQNAALAVQVGEENVITKRFAALAGELDQTELELLDAKSRHHRTQQMYESPSQRPFLLEMASSRQQAAAEIRAESQLRLDLEKQRRALDLQLAAEQAKWGDGHPRVRLLLESRADLEKRLADQTEVIEETKDAIVAAYVATVEQEYQLLEEKRSELQRSYDKQYQLAMQANFQNEKLKALENAVQRVVQHVGTLDQQIKQLNLTEQAGPINVSIIDAARPPAEPSFPSRPRFLAIGMLLGGLSGFGLAWLRDLMDHRLKSIDEIAATLQLPVLGALPLTEGRENRPLVGKVLLVNPRSTASEAFRTLRTAIHFSLAGDEEKVLAVTSPSPGDGKSTVVSNLAIAMAQADKRVLLIDADLRKPTQHTIFEIEPGPGLAAVLAERRPVEEAIQETEVPGLHLLPCGRRPSNPVELLNNGFFGAMLETLKQRYDRIVIDSPPVMPVADARVIGAQVDATILVLRADSSTRRMSLAARDELWRVRAQRLGVVVNAVPIRKQTHYAGGYGDGYGYGGYGNYGYVDGGYGDDAYGEQTEPLPGRQRKNSRALATARVVQAGDDPPAAGGNELRIPS